MSLPAPQRTDEVLVFVYGTLLRGESNHQFLSGARYVAEASTPPSFELFDLGGFPAMVEGGTTAIRGEVWACSNGVIDRLDELEDHPDYFRRARIQLDDGSPIDSYLLPGVQASFYPRIASGNWRERYSSSKKG
jgi:gamma-glutamylaminecyclotransferase